MQQTIPCNPCSGTGRTDAADQYGQFDACPTCQGEGAMVRCSCGATVALRDAHAQCPETVARRAAEAKLRAEGWDALGRTLGKAQKLIPGMTIELLP